ncbi:MAG: hypothetical protein LQ346_004210 [Caloplaca aetnensis]|nr:MAG: hypothetical protein LQ346_004210 [Caloplaca aetnensis]
MQNTAEDISNQAKGHKANLSNPNTSEASKERSKEVLESLGGDSAFYSNEDQNVSKKFTADVILRLVKNTALNPSLTLPLYLLSRYTRQGRELAAGHDLALNRLKVLVYAGIVRWVNNFLSNTSVNNWSTSNYDWNKEIVVITGGSDGLGKIVGKLLAEKGAKIAILDIQPLTFEPPKNITFFKCDVTSPSEVSSTASSVRSEVGTPTVLINNAGIAAGLAVLNTTEESVNKVFQVNILSHFRLIREFLPAMVAANHGTVVTIASIAAGA